MERTGKKGIYFDGHERDDVNLFRADCVRVLQSLEKYHRPAPLPNDVDFSAPQPGYHGNPSASKHLVLIFHDETTFQSSDDQTKAWGQADQVFLRNKGRGAGIMISDFIKEFDGFLGYGGREARVQLEIGAGKEGYWNAERNMFPSIIHYS